MIRPEQSDVKDHSNDHWSLSVGRSEEVLNSVQNDLGEVPGLFSTYFQQESRVTSWKVPGGPICLTRWMVDLQIIFASIC